MIQKEWDQLIDKLAADISDAVADVLTKNGLMKDGKPVITQPMSARTYARIPWTEHTAKAIRKFSGMSQEAFAEALKISTSTLTRWESKKQLPRKTMQRRLYCYVNNHFLAGTWLKIRATEKDFS